MDKLKAIRVPLFIIGLLSLFSAERYFADQVTYWPLLAFGSASIALSLLLNVWFARRAIGQGLREEGQCWNLLLYWKLSFIVAICGYFTAKWIGKSEGVLESSLSNILVWVYLTSAVVGLFLGIGLELANRWSGEGETAEPKRLAASASRWLGVGLLLAGLFALNYGTNRQDKVFDLSYFKATKPGESTLKVAAQVQNPVKIGVFFSKDSDVLPFVKEYISAVAKQNDKLEVSFYDKDFQPLQAEEFRVSRNGQIVLSRDGRRQRIDVGDKIENARAKLKTLDRDFQKNLLALTAEAKNIYFLANHGEMSWSLDKNSPPRSIRALEALMRSQNINPRSLGTAFDSIPDDASAIAVASPIASLVPQEVQAIKDFLAKGGRLLLFLDVEFGGERPQGLEAAEQGPLFDFLKELGAEYVKDALVSDTEYINQRRGSQVDKLLLYTNVFGSHESVSTLTRNDDKLAVFTFYSGAFQLGPGTDGWRTVGTILSMRSSYLDKNKNLQFDEGLEKKDSVPIAIASEKDLSDGKKAKVLAFADATMFSDPLMSNGGNQLAALESLRWLIDRNDISGAIETEEDVKIQHSKGRELFVFMGSIYAIPVLIILLGFWVNRRKRNRV